MMLDDKVMWPWSLLLVLERGSAVDCPRPQDSGRRAGEMTPWPHQHGHQTDTQEKGLLWWEWRVSFCNMIPSIWVKLVPVLKDHFSLLSPIYTQNMIVCSTGEMGRYPTERKHFKTFPWTIASKRIKYPGINFIKKKRHKPLMKETEEDTKEIESYTMLTEGKLWKCPL